MWNLIINTPLILVLFAMLFANVSVQFATNLADIMLPDIKTTIAVKSCIWSIFVHLPIIYMILYFDYCHSSLLFVISFVGGWFLHTLSEDAYYRKQKIHYRGKEFYAIIQIILIWLAYFYNY